MNKAVQMDGATRANQVTQVIKIIQAIALNTFREILRDKIVYAFFVFACVTSAFGLILGSLSIGQDVRMVLDLGLVAINIIGGIIAVFSGANLVYKELDKKTCYLIFTKPVESWQFILGKYLGLSGSLAILVFAMGIFLNILLYVVSPPAFAANLKFVLLSVASVYLELLLVIAAATFFSTFSSPTMSVIFTISFWLIGHWAASLQDLAKLSVSPLAQNLAKACYWLLPDLQSLTRARFLLMYGHLPGLDLLIYTIAYLLAYIIILLVSASLVTEKRELP